MNAAAATAGCAAGSAAMEMAWKTIWIALGAHNTNNRPGEQGGLGAYSTISYYLATNAKDFYPLLHKEAKQAGLNQDTTFFTEWPPIDENLQGFAPFLLAIMKTHLMAAQSSSYDKNDKAQQIYYATDLLAQLENLISCKILTVATSEHSH